MPYEKSKKYFAIMIRNSVKIALVLLFICHTTTCFAEYNPVQNREQGEDRKTMKMAKNTKLSSDERAISSQPRMYTSGGHLFFETASSYNISFKTNDKGSINFDGTDLKPLMAQVEKNRQDILDIKNSGGGTVPPDLQDQVDTNKQNIQQLQTQANDHNSRLDDLESQYTTLQATVTSIQNDLNKDECSGSPCRNGGTCTNLYKSFLCTCPAQYEGPTCELDHNECLDFDKTGAGCQNGGTCVNLDGGFQCNCPPSYYGPLCASVYDDCTDGNDKCVHGLCVNSPRDDPNVPKYSCICDNGWASVSDTDPTCTKDVDECLNTPCSANPLVQCYNTQGSFTCGDCPSGYQGNGYYCADIDECATHNGGCNTSPLVQCINIPGSSYCGPCPAGYTGDGVVCTPQDPCTSNNGGCHPIASCSYNPAAGAVACTCPPGYVGTGIGPYGCSLSDNNCTDTCVNGQCIMSNGQLTCMCDPGWMGDNCDYNINECGSNPCQHGGKCNDGINGYTCTCNSGYSGTNCELQQSACGGDYEASSGSFLYPATNEQTYPSESDCTWTVKVPLGKAASVTFPKFDLEQSTDCKNDFLQINDGPRLDSPVIGKYCGSSTPGGGDAILSTGNELLFWFSSNDANSGQGFQVVWTSQDPVCGGDITGVEYGTISSPGYPGNYPNNRDCYWTISVVAGNVIQLLLGTIDLETSSDCSKDYLEIRDGILSTDPVLATYCTSISAAPLLTTSSGARLYLHTSEANTGTGFFIQWSILPTVCGGYISDDDGIIISPNYPNVYDNDQQCVWQIHVGDYGKISVTFTDLDIPGDENCANDYIEVRDGPRESSPLAARYCGTTIPPIYTSSGQDLYLKFKSDQYATGKGFRLLYTVACGGTYTFESGTLVSPYYPSMYPNDKECEYTIRQPPGYLITLTIEDIDIENDPTCASDYLEIHDGSIEESPLLGKICGNVPAPPMMSTQNYMFIHFKSNSQNNGRGFRASYTSANTGCGGVYTDAVGSLKSPSHPSSYPHGVNCTYYIWVDPSLIISLQFLSFSLQDSEDGDCNDYVEVFDGPDTDSPSLGRFCGSTVPPTLVSKSFEMTLLFTTDNNTDSQGFAAAYTTQNASTACGGYISDQEGYISSPNYPDNYPAMRTCVWTITMPSSMQIQVDFADFAFEAGNAEGTCSFDYLEIRNGGYEDSPLIGEYCGNNNPGTFISHSNQLYVKMVTDQYTEARGFLMNYNAGVTGCGGTLTSADGGFQSPNYPFPYPHAAECTWLIQVSQGSTVRLLFSNFDIETHGFCEFDYVEAYDGPNAGYPSLGRVCGTRIPEPYESSDNSLFVRFRSDGNTAGSGFLAQYHTICERTITSRVSGVIESLDFPDNYPPNRDCTWTIQGSYGNPLNATFKTFAVETCDNCNCDFVEIIDGDDSDSTSLGKYCGSQLPPIIRTSGSSLQVVFHSDPYQQAPGFQLAWAVDGCGNTFTNPSGEFSSPNYPNNYDDNKECIWQIITDPGTNIQLTIDVFDVEHHSDCQYDTLEVYNGLYVDEDYRIAQLCNSNSPPHLPMKVSSTSSFMTVRFITDELVNGKGFHASYEQKTGGCGGLLTSQSGTIRSPNFPNTYPANTDCEWLIDVGKGTTVTLAFETFDIEEEPNCEFDYVAAYDGNSTTGTQLMKACGKTLPPTIQSYDNMMLVQFHSDPFTAHSGFEANFYSSGCGGRLTASITMNEDIMSINYPNNYPANQNCTWTISAPQANGHITLKFTHLDLYTNVSDNSPCGTYDYILFLDGTSVSSPEFARYCGSTIPAPITSFSNAFTIVFVSQSPEQRGGFRFLYSASTSGCGGDLTSQSGYFNSPNFPEEYPVDTDCVWTIRSSPGNRVQLSFLFFDMEEHDSCNFDYVEIKEGSADGQTIARVCGSKIPANVSSIVGHILYVKFHSDVGTVGRGFQAYYQHLYGGTTIGEFSGDIASPMYPSTYPDLIDAYYYVYAPTGRLIYFEFTLLDLQGLTDEGCPYDYVIIYDGDSESSPALAAGCGTGYLPQGTTSQPAMMVWFHSDLGISGRGFYISWSAVDGGGIGPNPTNVPTIEPGVCGSNHMVAPLAPLPLYSPGWPDNYPNNQDCRWLIEAASGYRVEFTVLSMDIEGAGIACVDSLTIYDGPDITSREIITYCGKSAPPTPLYSTQEFMLVRFKSDSTLPYGGFTAQYQQGCGGTITSNQGIITSPNYPGDYPVDTDCVWVISATLGYTISLDFNSQYEIINSDSDQCGEDNGDYLQLLNGKFDDSPPLPGVDGDGRYCGTSPPTGLKTSSYYLYVKFRSDSQSTGNGFSLTFTAAGTGCGGNLQLTDELNAGTFSSPNYPSAYPHGADCIWIISAPAGEAIQLDFTAFSVEGDSSCRYDYVAVVDGQTSNDPILGIYCGSSQPPTTKSTGNTMLVRFRTDETTAAGGFQATYKIAACGGLLTGTSGFIQSPNYPDNYPNSVSCDWEVRGPAYHFLAFRFTYFNLFGSDTCESGKGDFIEFRLSNATAPPIATVCGSTNPGQIDTDDNIAHIHFESDSSDTSGGFRMEFKASEDICGGELTGPTGLLTTPNYPNEYDHARVCTWYITVASDRRVTLEFIDFDVEEPHEDFGCVFDYVQIYNGILPNSPRLATLCGAALPGKYSTTGNTMKVILKTDGSVSNGGFAATYSSDDPRVCGGVLNDFSGGLFTTPNYPDNYGYNQECLWTITAPVQTNVTTVIMFRDFSLEHHVECNYDKVIFKAGTGYDGYLYQTLCGDTKPEDFALALPDSFIQFISDYSVNDKGFQASYQFKPCGGLVTGTTSGVIASPNFPAPYNSNDFCLWTIAVPAGQHIKLQWTNFHVESHSLCGYDYVKVFNGPTPSSPLVGTYCNDNEPGDFTAGSNTVTILFRSDYSEQMDGWRVKWSADTSGCGNVIIHKHYGVITSPNYPNEYPGNSDCTWTILPDPAYHVDITFEDDFQIEQQSECAYDYVAIFDGPSESSSKMNQFCGYYGTESAPGDDTVVESSEAALTMRFRSDFSRGGKGFKAYYEAHCGLTLKRESGTFQSPNYPSPYNNNEQCFYLITYPDEDKFIKLTFTRFDLESGTNTACIYDYVKVYAGTTTDDRLLGSFCGNFIPTNSLSSQGSMLVVFATDSVTVDYGFQADYEGANCGGFLTDTTGSINAFTHSNIHNNGNCTWQIQVADNKVVELEFTSFDVEAHISCSYDYVNVYDGLTTFSPLIGTYCGNFVPKYLISSTNEMTIEFITDAGTTETGFTSIYRQMPGPMEGCGGLLTEQTGSFSSLDLDGDGNYDANLNCLWVIQGTENQIITISFTKFDLENGTTNGCIYDRVEIHDGQTELDPIAVSACGIIIPAPFTSSTNFLSVRFIADPYVQYTGFEAHYTMQEKTCGGNYKATSDFQEISYPPASMPSIIQNANCRWTIDAGTDITKYIMVTFTQVDIQSPSNTGTNCNSAYLEVRDYPPGDLVQSFKYCSNGHNPSDFHSLGQMVQLNLKTDADTTGQGFKVQYRGTNCSRDLTQPYGQIFSPGWPTLYPHDTICITTITVPEDNQIQMFFNEFELEYHVNCSFDYLEIRDGPTEDSPLLQRLCGTSLPNPIFPTSNSLFMKLSSDPFVHEKGFDITYTSTPNACGGIITGDHGTITSLDFPQAYSPNTTCEFSIRAPSGRPVTVHMTYMDVYYECGSNGCYCADDVIWIYGGPDRNSPLIAGYCGYGRVSDLQSPVNSAFVRFVVSDFEEGTRSNTGFRIEFES